MCCWWFCGSAIWGKMRSKGQRLRSQPDQGHVAFQDRSRPVASAVSVIGWEMRPVLILATGCGLQLSPDMVKWGRRQMHHSQIMSSSYVVLTSPLWAALLVVISRLSRVKIVCICCLWWPRRTRMLHRRSVIWSVSVVNRSHSRWINRPHQIHCSPPLSRESTLLFRLLTFWWHYIPGI